MIWDLKMDCLWEAAKQFFLLPFSMRSCRRCTLVTIESPYHMSRQSVWWPGVSTSCKSQQSCFQLFIILISNPQGCHSAHSLPSPTLPSDAYKQFAQEYHQFKYVASSPPTILGATMGLNMSACADSEETEHAHYFALMAFLCWMDIALLNCWCVISSRDRTNYKGTTPLHAKCQMWLSWSLRRSPRINSRKILTGIIEQCAGRAHRHQAHQRDHHVPHLCQVGAVSPGPAHQDQPVVQHCGEW